MWQKWEVERGNTALFLIHSGRWGQALALAKRTGEEVMAPYMGPASDEEYRERRLAFIPDASSYYNPYSRYD